MRTTNLGGLDDELEELDDELELEQLGLGLEATDWGVAMLLSVEGVFTLTFLVNWAAKSDGLSELELAPPWGLSSRIFTLGFDPPHLGNSTGIHTKEILDGNLRIERAIPKS